MSTLGIVFAIPLDSSMPLLFNALILCFPYFSGIGESIGGVLRKSLPIIIHERLYLVSEVVSSESPYLSTINSHLRTWNCTRQACYLVGKLNGAFLAPLSGYNLHH